MWLTSKRPQLSRTALCSAVIPVGYCTGISKPAKGTILAPRATWMAWKGVFLSGASDIGPFSMVGPGNMPERQTDCHSLFSPSQNHWPNQKQENFDRINKMDRMAARPSRSFGPSC